MQGLANAPDDSAAPRLTTRVITEKLARQCFKDLLAPEDALGSRQPNGRSLYQVVCRGEAWVGLVLWTGAIWHLKARDLYLGWDPLIRSERLQLMVHPARFLVPAKAREPNLASAALAASARDLPAQGTSSRVAISPMEPAQFEESAGCAPARPETRPAAPHPRSPALHPAGTTN